MTSPSRLLRVVQIGTIPGCVTPTCDPALNLAAPGAPEALSRYERTRSDADRDALPLLPDARPVLFEVSPLTPAAYRFCMDATGATRDHRAFTVACHALTDERGVRHEASAHGGTETAGTITQARDAWIEHVASLVGEAAVREVAKVALDRAEAGPRALAPFALPRGLMLPR
jgi:hypothetical protein